MKTLLALVMMTLALVTVAEAQQVYDPGFTDTRLCRVEREYRVLGVVYRWTLYTDGVWRLVPYLQVQQIDKVKCPKLR